MNTYDVDFTTAGIELTDANGTTYTLPHIEASTAMADEDYNQPHQERDIVNYFRANGYSITGLYSEFPTATKN